MYWLRIRCYGFVVILKDVGGIALVVVLVVKNMLIVATGVIVKIGIVFTVRFVVGVRLVVGGCLDSPAISALGLRMREEVGREELRNPSLLWAGKNHKDSAIAVLDFASVMVKRRGTMLLDRVGDSDVVRLDLVGMEVGELCLWKRQYLSNGDQIMTSGKALSYVQLGNRVVDKPLNDGGLEKIGNGGFAALQSKVYGQR